MKYLNRDISWLSFNQRVLDEGGKTRHPLAERISFHGIAFSNVDEFMMVRYPSAIEFEPEEVIKELHEKIVAHHLLLAYRFNDFNQENHLIVPFSEVRQYSDFAMKMKTYFKHNVFSALQPITIPEDQTIMPRTPIILYVETSDEKGDQVYSNYIEIPTALNRFINIPGTSSFILLEDLIMDNLDMLFQDMKIVTACAVSILRSAEVYLKDDTLRDPYEIIQKTLLERNRSWVTKIEIGSNKKGLIRRIKEKISITDHTLVCSSEYVHLSDLKRIDDSVFKDSDRFRKLVPINPFPAGSIFDIIKDSDRLVFHPYESYTDSVVRFIKEAADDPKVVSIKITLYRVAEKSRIIDALVKAASTGKHVTVLVELKARFDEKHNIQIANILKEAGINLVYGSLELKTHAKVCLVTRKEKRLRIYSHIGTGNYNESTAKIYTDYSYFTADQDTGNDLTKFFSLLTSEQGKFKSKKILYAPYNLRSTITESIDREAKEAKNKRPARIIIKCNSLTDDKISDKLVEAAKEGVKITLYVRGACIIRPIQNIKIYSIVGRFLEHSRIYVFGKGKRTSLYIGSSDIMHRNLNRRNELMFCVEDDEIKERILKHLKSYRADNVNRRIILDNYQYEDAVPTTIEKEFDCQASFIKEAKKRAD